VVLKTGRCGSLKSCGQKIVGRIFGLKAERGDNYIIRNLKF
jgi:hypothetical protein